MGTIRKAVLDIFDIPVSCSRGCVEEVLRTHTCTPGGRSGKPGIFGLWDLFKDMG